MEISHIFTVAAISKDTSYYSHTDDMTSVKCMHLIIINYIVSVPFNIRYSQNSSYNFVINSYLNL
jgi:hypothetical protein